MFGLTFDKLLVIGIIAVFVLGPERLPQYAAGLARLVKGLRNMASNAKERMRDEMGPEFDEINWKDLDPRRYDPRRIIREALLDDPILPGRNSVAGAPTDAAFFDGASPLASRDAGAGRSRSDVTPFDSEAT